LAEVVHIRDHPEIRDRPDIMRRIYEAGHRPFHPANSGRHYMQKVRGYTAKDRRDIERHPEKYGFEDWDAVLGNREANRLADLRSRGQYPFRRHEPEQEEDDDDEEEDDEEEDETEEDEEDSDDEDE